MKSKTVGRLFFMLLLLAFSSDAVAQTRVGLHVTQEELNIWKRRAEKGPYKVSGDVSTNSPGDWLRIQGKAKSFLANPAVERWAGQTSPYCWRGLDFSHSIIPKRQQGENLLAAAFYYLVTGASSYRDAVKKELLAQSAEAGTNFADAARWQISKSCTWGDGRSFDITNWLTKLLFAYDYIRASLTSSERDRLDKWFLNAAVFWEKPSDATIKTRFPNRNNDDYDTLGTPLTCEKPVPTHFGGLTKCNWHEGWNNRAAAHVRFFGLVGIMLDQFSLKLQAKRFFKEWLKFHVFSDNTDAEYHRWRSDFPSLGWAYTSLLVGSMTTIADAFARTGDEELYKFSTSAGIGSLTPAGGPKSLRGVITRHLQHVNNALRRYGTSEPSNNGNPAYRVGPVDGVNGQASERDTYFSIANIYLRDQFTKDIYTRSDQNTPRYPSVVSTGGWSGWTGEWGVYPGVLFMFGQMEGIVWPYPIASSVQGSGLKPPHIVKLE